MRLKLRMFDSARLEADRCTVVVLVPALEPYLEAVDLSNDRFIFSQEFIRPLRSKPIDVLGKRHKQKCALPCSKRICPHLGGRTYG